MGRKILEKSRGLLRSSREVSAERESCRSSGEAFRPEGCGGRIQFLRILASGRPADLLPGLPGACTGCNRHRDNSGLEEGGGAASARECTAMRARLTNRRAGCWEPGRIPLLEERAGYDKSSLRIAGLNFSVLIRLGPIQMTSGSPANRSPSSDWPRIPLANDILEETRPAGRFVVLVSLFQNFQFRDKISASSK